MIVEFGARFLKDIRSIQDKVLLKRIGNLIGQMESLGSLQEIPDLRKLKGAPYHYRIRVGDYRIGFTFTDDKITLIRCLNRKEMYRYFP